VLKVSILELLNPLSLLLFVKYDSILHLLYAVSFSGAGKERILRCSAGSSSGVLAILALVLAHFCNSNICSLIVLDNGTMAADDYVKYVTDENEAKINLAIHQMQLVAAQINYLTIIGKL